MIILRQATEADLPLIMAWRSNPLVYKGYYTQKAPLKWEEHKNWWNSRNQDWRTFMVIYEERPIGILNIGQLDHWSPEIGYTIGEVSLWGRGLATEIIRTALLLLLSYGKEYVHTTVLKSNKASIRALEKNGFKYWGEARKGEVWMQRKL